MSTKIDGYTGSVATNTALSVNTVATNNQILGYMQQCVETDDHICFHSHRSIHFFGLTCGCFRQWRKSDKCIVYLLKYHSVFLEVFGFVQVNKPNACRKHKVMGSQIPSAFARNAPGLEASTCHSNFF